MADRPLRVTVASDARAIWGSERSTLGLVPHLAELGVEVTLACPPGEFARAGADLGLPHVPTVVPPRGGERRHPLRDVVGDARTLPAGVRRIAFAARGADVLHSNNLLLHLDSALAGRRAHVPTVLELHDTVSTGAGGLALSAAAGLADATVAISRATTAGIRGPGRSRVRIVPQAVDVTRFSPGPANAEVRASLGGGPLLVTIVGRLDPSKGIHRLVEAARELPDVHVAVVGAPSLDSGAYAERVARHGRDLLGDRFTLAGPRTDVVDVLRSCDVLVNASDAEPFGMSVLEAMACAKPVVATRSGGIPEFVADGETGLLFDPDDVTACTAALRSLHDPAFREKLGAAGRLAVLAGHTVEGRAARFAEIYRAVVSSRPASTSTERLAVR